jgi:hypothetical protein
VGGRRKRGNYSPGRENEAVTEHNSSCRFRAFMTNRFSLDLSRSRVNDTHFFVLASCDQLRAVPVEARTEDNVRMTVDVQENLAGADIPNDNLIVGSGGEEDVECRGMPQNETDATLVIEQINHRFGEGP